MIEGSSVDYPFDVYYAVCTVQVYSSNVTLPLALTVGGNVDSWNVDVDFLQYFDRLEDAQPVVLFYLTFSRSIVSIFFCIFISVIMWILALFAIGIAISVWTRGRKVEPPTIAFTGALLFALPAIRNSQVLFYSYSQTLPLWVQLQMLHHFSGHKDW
jgi:hypothetical protein